MEQGPVGPNNSRSAPARLQATDCTPTEARFDPAQFLQLLREDAFALRRKFNGALPRDQDRDDRIDLFVRRLTAFYVREGAIAPEYSTGFPAAATRLLLCFERVCHQTGGRIQDEKPRELVYQYLLDQLVGNTRFFNFAPKILVTATLMSRVSLTQLPGAEFVRQSGDTRRLFYRAFTGHAQSIEEFFERGRKRLDELSTVLREQDRAMPRNLQLQFAFFRVSDSTLDLVAQHFSLVDTICSEEKFASVPRSLVDTVVGRTRADSARAEIERILQESQKLLDDPQIRAVFEKRRSHVVYAVQGHRKGAKEYLLKAADTEVRLERLYGQLNEEFSRKKLRDLCVKDPTGAAVLEQELRNRVEQRGCRQVDSDALPPWML